jgi:hypothetical protein
VLLVWRLPRGRVRRFCLSLLLIDAASAAVFCCYVAVGVDEIDQHYIGYFGWANPAVALLAIALAGIELLGRPAARFRGPAVATVAAMIASAAACCAFAVAPGTRVSAIYVDPANPRAGYSTDASLPSGVAAMARRASGRPIALSFPHDGWAAVTGILVQAERTGVHACVAAAYWAFMMTSQFTCTPAELARGYPMNVDPTGEEPLGAHAVTGLQRAIVTDGGKGT